MKGLAWYCRVAFSLFILICAVFVVTRLMKYSIQNLIFASVLAVYIVPTVLAFKGTQSVLSRKSYDRKGWAIFGLIWASLVVLLPVIQLFSSISLPLIFMLLTGGYEWSFIAVSLLMAVLFIPVIVFFSIYLSRARKSSVQLGGVI